MKTTLIRDFSNFEKFLTTKGVSKNSVRFYVSDIRVFVRWLTKVTGSSKISKESFESYEMFLKNSGLPSRSVNRKLSSLRKYNEFLVSKKIITTREIAKFKNSPKNSDFEYFDFRKIKRQISIVPQGVFLFLMFVVIVLFGGIIVFDRRELTNINLPPKETKLSVPLTINIGSDTEQNLGKLASNTDPNFIQLDTNPVFLKSNLFNVSDTGRSEIPAGSVEKTIYVSSATKSSYVFVTPLSDANIFVKSQDEGYFVVSVNGSLLKNVRFNWMVVNGKLPVDTNQ